jgi:hypothetical protein
LASAPLISHRPPADRPGSAAPLRPVPRPAPAPAAGGRRRSDLPLLVLIGIPVLVTAWGLPYYLAPTAGRLRHPLHSLLKSSGPVGLAFGAVALLMFLFMWLYPLRKQAKWLAWTGPIGEWMNVHVVMGLSLPVIAAVHAGWHFDGLIGLGMLAMVIVSLSGVIGRYLYTHIPRDRAGLELSLEQVGGERRALLTQIAIATGLTPQEAERSLALDPRPYAGLGLVRTFARLIADDWRRGWTLRRLRREWSRRATGRAPLDRQALGSALKLARREMALQQQVRALEATRRVFAWWHVAHRPFALTALLAVLVHVVVAIWIGGVRFTVFGGP